MAAGAPMQVYRRPVSFIAMELLAEPYVNRFMRAGKSCALRPEHVAVADAMGNANAIGFDMHVTAYETNGDESFIHGRVDENDWVGRCHGMREVHAGCNLSLQALPGDVVSF